MKQQKHSVDQDTLDFHNENHDELLLDKNGIAVFKINTAEPYLKVYVDGKHRVKWRVGDTKGAYDAARQLQFEDQEAEAAQALGA